MIPGTTSGIKITMPIDIEKIRALAVVFSQGGKEIATKNKSECELNGKTVKVRLTQEESLRFANNSIAEVQAHFLDEHGERFSTQPMQIPIGYTNYRGVLR